MSATSATERRLQSWPWRLGHSVWTLWAIVSIGLFTFVGFGYIAWRARSQRWAVMAGVWFAVFIFLMFVVPSPLPDSWGWVIFGVWMLSIAHTLSTLPAWWRWRAEQAGPDFGRIKRHSSSSGPSAASGTPQATGTPQPSAPAGPHPPAVTGSPSAAVATAAQASSVDPSVDQPAPEHSPSLGFASPQPQQLGIESVIPGLGVIDGQPEDGHGSFGTVYRIRRDFDGKHVAGKVFRAQPGLHGSLEAERSLRDEMAALEQLHHPNIVRVMNPVRVGEQGAWILVSEWVEGTTLELATLGVEPMTDEQVFAVGAQLLDALVYLESVGVVHRDIKPTNVMIDAAGGVKLIDFNLTRTSGRETVVAGTKPYLPPDYMLDGNAVDALVDRFATGVLLYELLTRKHPYVEYEHAAAPVLVTSVPADPQAFRPDLSQDLAVFLTRSVQPREANRFASAADMRAAWITATSSATSSSHSPPPKWTSATADPNDEAATPA